MVFFHICRAICYLPLAILFPTKVVGKENLQKGLKAIIVSNHTSNMDSVLFALHLGEYKYFLAKKELFKNKLMGWFMKKFGGIKIDRQANDITAIKNCMKVLKEDKKLLIFPEGTRNKNKGEDLELGEIKGGAAMLAIKTKSPVVPIYINRRPKMFRKTTITIGDPFEFAEFYGDKLDSYVLDNAGEILANKMQALRSKVIEKQKAKNAKLSKEEKKRIKEERKEKKKLARLSKKNKQKVDSKAV